MQYDWLACLILFRDYKGNSITALTANAVNLK